MVLDMTTTLQTTPQRRHCAVKLRKERRRAKQGNRAMWRYRTTLSSSLSLAASNTPPPLSPPPPPACVRLMSHYTHTLDRTTTTSYTHNRMHAHTIPHNSNVYTERLMRYTITNKIQLSGHPRHQSAPPIPVSSPFQSI